MLDSDIVNFSEKQLVAEIEKHNHLYWEHNTPEISDEQYDTLMRRLEEINPEHPILKTVGAAHVASLGKVKLDEPMISLEKTYYFKDAPVGKKSLLKWASECKRSEEELFLIQPKYDGISAIYSGGILATRGQGTEEENVTDKVPLIELETKGYKGALNKSVRGEIIIRKDDFKTIYSKIKKVDGSYYKNSRNAVGGIMGLKDISDIKKQGAKLTLVDYNLISFAVAFKDIEKKWQNIVEKIEALPYPMDGIVVKLADRDYRDSLGYTAHHPRGQIAFKFSGLRKQTKLIDVEWSFGKNCLTPVGKVEPIELGGVTIKNVTLHNLKIVREKDWHIGDYVLIERAGDVIPHIVDSEPGEKRISFIIKECPCCHSNLKFDEVELRCVNPTCFETNLQRILAAVRNIGIEELGEPTIRKMMLELGVKKLKNIFNLRIDDLIKLEGFKEKSSSNLYNSIQTAKDTTDYQLIAALNIEGIGQVVASKILKDYTLKELREMTKIQLSFIPEIGPETSEKLFNALKEQTDILDELLATLNVKSSKTNNIPNTLICVDFDTTKFKKPMKYYEHLLFRHNLNRIKPVQINSILYFPENLKTLVTTKNKDSNTKIILKAKEVGAKIMTPDEWERSLPILTDVEKETEEKTICFTGKMPEARRYYEDLAIARGYKPVDMVTKDLTLLVAADVNATGSKLEKARASNIKIVSLESWLKTEKSSKQNTTKEKDPNNNSEQGFFPGF